MQYLTIELGTDTWRISQRSLFHETPVKISGSGLISCCEIVVKDVLISLTFCVAEIATGHRTMPKKFKGENSKAVVARARKAAIREEEEGRKKKEIEDAYWQDDDKHVQRKAQRKDDKEKKRLEALQRKKETQQLLEEEASAIKSAKPPPTGKVTRAQIATNQEIRAAEAVAASKPAELVHDEVPLEENTNLLMGEEGEARSVADAISVLSVKEPALEKHPERRVKAAYQAFEDKNLPLLKVENPNLRLSQLKQMLKKDWMKSPENPLNQRQMAYNAKR